MSETNLGQVAVSRLRELIGAESFWAPDHSGFDWCCWGVRQRAWSHVSRYEAGRPIWRLQLRTYVVAGFNGSAEQLRALSEGACPAFAGLVRNPDRPDALELCTALDVDEENVDWVVRVLDAAARVQATEAHVMSLSNEFTAAGLTPQASVDEWTYPLMKRGGYPVDERARGLYAEAWDVSAIDRYISLLRSFGAHAVQTRTGISASLPSEDGADALGILDVTQRDHPALGWGISIVLWTRQRDGVAGALDANERDLLRPTTQDLSLGGWWAGLNGVLRHCNFYPYALIRAGVVEQLLAAAVRRARTFARVTTQAAAG